MFKQRNTLLLLFFGILFFCFIRLVLLFDGLYGQDAYEYLRYTESLQNYFTTGKNPGDYFWGVYYPLIGSFLAYFVGKSALALQFISFFSLIVSSVYLTKIIELVYKEKTNPIIIFLFFFLSPIVLIHSFLVMSDMLTCAFVLISIYCFLSYFEFSKYKSFLFGVAFGLLAVLTRYAVIVVLFPFCMAVLFKLIKNKHYKLVVFSIPIIFAVSFPHVVVKSQNSLQFLSHSWLQNWNILNLFKSQFVTVDGESYNNFINVIYIGFQFIHPVFLVFGIVAILIFIRDQDFKTITNQKLVFFSIVLYSLFLGGIPFQNKRFLIQSFPLIIVFIYPQLKKMVLLLKNQKVVFGIVFLIQISLTAYFGKQYYDRNCLEKKISTDMKPYQNETLYVFDIDIAMQGRGLKFKYKNLFLEKYTDFENEALVLINEKQLNEQWKGKNPLINWENIQKKCVLIKLKTVEKNWSLYKISALK